MQVFERPSGPRLVYLIGALALLAALALLRHGRRPVRLGVAAGGLAVALPAAVVVVALGAPSLTGTIVSDVARGPARTVVGLWLAGIAAPLRPATVNDAWGQVQVESYLGNVWYGERELGYTAALLDRGDARELVRDHWDVLVNPATTVDQLAILLGLPAVPADSTAEPLRGTPCG